MLVVKVISKTQIEVIHYGYDTAKHRSSKGKVVQEKIKIDNMEQEKVVLLRYHNGEDKYAGVAAIERAQGRLDEQKYCLFSNNCECFINWAITGQSDSNQVDSAVDTTAKVAVGVGVLAAVGAGVAAMLGAFSVGKEEDKEERKEGKRKKKMN